MANKTYSILEKAIRKEQIIRLMLLTLAFLGSTYPIYHYFDFNTWLLGFSLLVWGFSLRAIYRLLLSWPIEKSQLIYMLREKPEDIVWVYSILTQRKPFGISFSQNAMLYFKLIDGDHICLAVPERDLLDLQQLLNRQLPHATFGFNKDRQQWYMASPALLLQSTEKK
ncbi:MAG: hypothetical protein AAFP19_14585 [Bacteroidota bacterium]